MKKKTIILLVLIVVLGLIAALVFTYLKPQKVEVAVGKPAPSFSLHDEKGDVISSGQFKDKVVILHFWATWCPPCIVELPAMAKFYEKYSTNDKIQFFFVLYQDSPENAREFFKSAGIALPLSFDNSRKTAETFGVTGVPETYVINRQGILDQRIIGSAEWEAPDASDYFSRLLSL